jgi:hypothetical protein
MTARCGRSAATSEDDLQRTLNTSQKSKISALHNGRNSEIWWFYPRGAENDSYVTWNYKENYWRPATWYACVARMPACSCFP